mmetsp:Transcript_12179/g.35357  ORF Transcript_12179/g.35357 Transcript_12179/m.35357 type:complete len:148 (+) Transcript_12179:72-515(+)
MSSNYFLLALPCTWTMSIYPPLHPIRKQIHSSSSYPAIQLSPFRPILLIVHPSIVRSEPAIQLLQSTKMLPGTSAPQRDYATILEWLVLGLSLRCWGQDNSKHIFDTAPLESFPVALDEVAETRVFVTSLPTCNVDHHQPILLVDKK